MDDIKKTLESWLNDLDSFSYKSYEELPDMNLYMEQIVQILEGQMKIFEQSSLDKLITPSMINNYVKGQVISSPLGKKYNREHIAEILLVCTLKQVLTINEVKEILTNNTNPSKMDSFNSFNEMNNEKLHNAITDAFKELNLIEGNDIEGLNELALSFALTANAYITIAKRILFLNRIYKELHKNDEAIENPKENEK